MTGANGHISLVGLAKHYIPQHKTKVEVLKRIDLTINRGATLAIVGESGVGKSTLLTIMGALERPSAGKVFHDHVDVFAMDENARARFRNRNVGFVFQFHHLLPEFNALENTMFPALIARMPRPEAIDRATEILGKVGLQDRVLHKPGELSGGEQQRVALARALVRAPELLLADEPTGNLDEKTGEKIFGLLLDLNAERGVTTVVVTHNMTLAHMMSRRVTIVEGTIEELP